MRPAWLLAALLVPLAAAATPDPLVLSWDAHPTPDGRLADDAPPAAALAFPASDPATPPASLSFASPAPVTAAVDGPVRVAFAVAADAPLVARDGAGASFEVALLVGGEAVATVRTGLDRPLLAPGDRAEVAVELPAGGALVEGQDVGLRITALMPAVPQDGLKLLLGDITVISFLSLRVPDVASLRMQDAPLAEFPAAQPYDAAQGTSVVDVRVTHDAILPGTLEATLGRSLVVVLRGEEEPETAALHAHANRSRRVDAAHEVAVGGTLVRVHPGVAVAVPAGSGPDPVRLACARNCPAGFEAVVRFVERAPPPVVTDDPGVLIPPPRSTEGIPVSGDEAPRPTPWGPLGLLALLLAATARRR